MFFIASKLLFYLLMPACWIATLLLWAVFTKNEKRKKRIGIVCLCLFLFFSNKGIINQFISWWELPAKDIATLPHYSVGIVLTGVVNMDNMPYDRVHFNKGADRIIHTIQLYKLGKLDKLLITGGNGSLTGERRSEAPELKKVCLLAGIPDSVIIVEPLSKNTRENALFSKRILDSLGIRGEQLLITSAYHMRRSKACFDKINLKTAVFPTDFNNTAPFRFSIEEWLIPNEGAFEKWRVLLHEWIGYVVYKLMGYC